MIRHTKSTVAVYPDALSGESITDIVRMLTISDIFAALIEHRHYKSYVNGEAVNQIVCEGVVVDPPKHRASFATG